MSSLLVKGRCDVNKYGIFTDEMGYSNAFNIFGHLIVVENWALLGKLIIENMATSIFTILNSDFHFKARIVIQVIMFAPSKSELVFHSVFSEEGNPSQRIFVN